MFKLLGKTLVTVACLIVSLGVILFVFGGYLLTLPIMRYSSAERKRIAMTQAGVTLFTLYRAFAPDPAENSRPSPPKSAP